MSGIPSNIDIKEFVDRIVEDGVMTNAEHDMLMHLIHKDGKIDDDESEQISRIFRLMKVGKLKIIDAVRSEFDRKRAEEGVADAIEVDDSDV
ncbi:MAG: TerB family tellurite resistance protein [Deltaproteobacteria bacterium]|nr:TerB family tellurite resistance protein [Deltaproteobacteria bacterium]